MAGVVARQGVPVIIMHNRETADPAIDIMADIAAFFARSLDLAARAGIAADRIVLDPGIGFGKTPEQSLTALARLDQLKAFGLPLLVGASRKRFIDKVSPAPPDRRLPRPPRPPPPAGGAPPSRRFCGGAGGPPASYAPTTSPRPCRH